MNDQGKFEEYDDTYDVVIHFKSEDEMKRFTSGQMPIWVGRDITTIHDYEPQIREIINDAEEYQHTQESRHSKEYAKIEAYERIKELLNIGRES
jgi:hypothetical protein